MFWRFGCALKVVNRKPFPFKPPETPEIQKDFSREAAGDVVGGLFPAAQSRAARSSPHASYTSSDACELYAMFNMN
jgi:hypothetical protein